MNSYRPLLAALALGAGLFLGVDAAAAATSDGLQSVLSTDWVESVSLPEVPAALLAPEGSWARTWGLHRIGLPLLGADVLPMGIVLALLALLIGALAATHLRRDRAIWLVSLLAVTPLVLLMVWNASIGLLDFSESAYERLRELHWILGLLFLPVIPALTLSSLLLVPPIAVALIFCGTLLARRVRRSASDRAARLSLAPAKQLPDGADRQDGPAGRTDRAG